MSLDSASILRRSLIVAVLSATPFIFGCSGQQLSYAPVAGIVTIDGKPVDRAEVVLSCEQKLANGPRPSTRGVTDKSGHFVLRSLTPEKQIVDGAVVARHKVSITTRILEEDAHGTRVVRDELLGRQYTNGEAITVDVPAKGIDDLRLELSSK
jgi:hypothetical protein